MNILKNICYNYDDIALCDAQFYVLGDCLGRYTVGFAAKPLMTIIHEVGHAGAAYLLYKNPRPEIKLRRYGYGGGRCTYSTSRLSKVGTWLGKSNAKTIVAAAGPVVEMAVSLALTRFFPGNGVSIVSLSSNAHYAISALSEKAFSNLNPEDSGGHDFVDVKIYKGGLAAGTLIVTSVALGIFGTFSLIMETVLAGIKHAYIKNPANTF